jgi:hypothetical protein
MQDHDILLFGWVIIHMQVRAHTFDARRDTITLVEMFFKIK